MCVTQRRLTGTPLPQANAYAMMASAGIETKIGNHTFRATEITAYLKKRRHARKGRHHGQPRLDTHDTALRSPARRVESRRGRAGGDLNFTMILKPTLSPHQKTEAVKAATKRESPAAIARSYNATRLTIQGL
jgi:hypothetical protein